MTSSKQYFVQYDEIQSLQEVAKMLIIKLQFVKSEKGVSILQVLLLFTLIKICV